MKRIIITLFLISLVANKELVEINSKIKREIQNRKEEKTNLRKLVAAGVGVLIIKETIKFFFSYLVGKLIDAIVENCKESRSALTSSFTPSHFKHLYKDNGKGLWISYIEDDYVVSMYYHETKEHTATCDGGLLGGGEIAAKADPGYWAIAYCKAGIAKRKTYYNHW